MDWGTLDGFEKTFGALSFHSIDGRLKGPALQDARCLTHANDGGATFVEIADFAEANPGAVFSKPS